MAVACYSPRGVPLLYLDSAEADGQRPWKCGRAIFCPARKPSTEANSESIETLLTCVTNGEALSIDVTVLVLTSVLRAGQDSRAHIENPRHVSTNGSRLEKPTGRYPTIGAWGDRKSSHRWQLNARAHIVADERDLCCLFGRANVKERAGVMITIKDMTEAKEPASVRRRGGQTMCKG